MHSAPASASRVPGQTKAQYRNKLLLPTPHTPHITRVLTQDLKRIFMKFFFGSADDAYPEDLHGLFRAVDKHSFCVLLDGIGSLMGVGGPYDILKAKKLLHPFYVHFKNHVLLSQTFSQNLFCNTDPFELFACLGYAKDMARFLGERGEERDLKKELEGLQYLMNHQWPLYFTCLLVLWKNLPRPLTIEWTQVAVLIFQAACPTDFYTEDTESDKCSCMELELFIQTWCQIQKHYRYPGSHSKFQLTCEHIVEWTHIVLMIADVLQNVSQQHEFNRSQEFWPLTFKAVHASLPQILEDPTNRETNEFVNESLRMMFRACYAQYKLQTKDPVFEPNHLYELITQMILHFPFNQGMLQMHSLSMLLTICCMNIPIYSIRLYLESLGSNELLVQEKLVKALDLYAETSPELLSIDLDDDSDIYQSRDGTLHNSDTFQDTNGDSLTKVDEGWMSLLCYENGFRTKKSMTQIMRSLILWIFAEASKGDFRAMI